MKVSELRWLPRQIIDSRGRIALIGHSPLTACTRYWPPSTCPTPCVAATACWPGAFRPPPTRSTLRRRWPRRGGTSPTTSRWRGRFVQPGGAPSSSPAATICWSRPASSSCAIAATSTCCPCRVERIGSRVELRRRFNVWHPREVTDSLSARGVDGCLNSVVVISGAFVIGIDDCS